MLYRRERRYTKRTPYSRYRAQRILVCDARLPPPKEREYAMGWLSAFVTGAIVGSVIGTLIGIVGGIVWVLIEGILRAAFGSLRSLIGRG